MNIYEENAALRVEIERLRAEVNRLELLLRVKEAAKKHAEERAEQVEIDRDHVEAYLMERTGSMIGWKLRAEQAEERLREVVDAAQQPSPMTSSECDRGWDRAMARVLNVASPPEPEEWTCPNCCGHSRSAHGPLGCSASYGADGQCQCAFSDKEEK